MRSAMSAAKLTACVRKSALPLARSVVTYRPAMPSMPTESTSNATIASTMLKPRCTRDSETGLRMLSDFLRAVGIDHCEGRGHVRHDLGDARTARCRDAHSAGRRHAADGRVVAARIAHRDVVGVGAER